MDHIKKVLECHREFFEDLKFHKDIISCLWPLDTSKVPAGLIGLDEDKVTGEIIRRKILIEGLALHIVRLLENLIVEDMVLLFAQNTEKYCECFSYELNRTIDHDEAEAILVGERYLDFKNFGDIVNFSKKHLVDAVNPFLKPPSCAKKLIDELLTVRNHIAHRSKKSRKNYQSILKKYKVQRELEPGYFLLSVPGQDNCEEIKF